MGKNILKQEMRRFWNKLQAPKLKIVDFANSVDLDDAARNEPPHLNLRC